ncbi:MAG: ftsW, partial [Frankiales bacterium]|nr:ftsW [Frankiales bacterium]
MKEQPRTSVLQGPLASYYLVLVSTGLLLAIGFIMVLSASSVRAYSTYGSVFAIAVKQGVFIAIGLP